MNDFLPTALVTIAGAILILAASLGLSRQEKKWVTLSFVMHVGFACAQVPLVLNFFGGGDMFGYFRYGEMLARMMDRDPFHVIPEVTALLLQERPHLPIKIYGVGSSTGSMSALAGWCFYLLGPSKYATNVVFAVLSLSGKIAIYRVFRANVEPALRFPAAIAALFVPSFVFWSSGLIKEAVAIAGFGWCVLGLDLWIREGRPLSGWALILLGAIPMWLIKPYILFPLLLAGGSWSYWARSLKHGRIRIRPMALVVGAVVSVGGIVVLGRHFPDYAVDAFGTESMMLQELGRRGGSAFALSSTQPTTPAGQFAYAPAALLTSLFRPVLFEAHNVPSLVNALETTAFTLLFLRILLTRNLGNVRRQIKDEPFLVFCIVFVLAFGVAVGLASSNLGTLSRYRIPLVPFFVVLLLVLARSHRVPLALAAVPRIPRTGLGGRRT